MTSSKHEEGWENSRQLCKQKTSSRNGFAYLSRILPAPRISKRAYVNTEKVFSIKYWSSPDLNSMRGLGVFTNKTFRKHLKLIFPHWDFITCIVSLAIFHPHFVIRIFPSAFYHPHFSFRHAPSAIRRHPVRTLQRPTLSRQITCLFFSCSKLVLQPITNGFALYW